MRTFALSVSLLALFAAPSVAQEGAPTPPQELAKFDRLIGNWEHAGQVWMQPGADPMEWTAKSRAEKALDDFAIKEDMVIDLGEMVPVPMIFHSFTTYDSQTRRYVSGGISNDGRVAMTEIHFAGDDTMISVDTMIEEGQQVVDQWVTTFAGKDAYTYVGRRSIAGGDFFDHIRGKAKRVQDVGEIPSPLDAPAFMVEPSAEIQKLARMCGDYKMKGEFTPMPGAPAVPISGRERIAPLFGGTVIGAMVEGDPTPGIGVYKARAAFGWNATKKCYVGIYINNMGEVGTNESHFIDGLLVNTMAGPSMGMPSASRGMITFDENGAIKKVASHVIMGTHEPMLMFWADYKRIDG